MNIRKCLIKFNDSDRTLGREFAEGITRIDSQKSEDVLIYAFLHCMLCGIDEQMQEDPKAKKCLADAGVVEGSLWFERDQKEYRLSRLFMEERAAVLFLLKNGSEQKLPKIPEMLSAGICGNMITADQIEAVNAGNLAQRLTGRRKAGSAERDARGAIQILKMTRKGFQNQLNKRRKEEEKSLSRRGDRTERLQAEIRELNEKRMRAAEEEIQEKYSRSAAQLEQELDAVWDDNQRLGRGMILTLIMTLVLSIALTFLAVIPALIVLAAGGMVLAVLWIKRKNTEDQIRELMQQQKKRKEKLKKLTRRRKALEEKVLDMEREIQNGRQALTFEEQKAVESSPEEVEIEALNMAIERIEALSGKGIIPFGNQLRQHTSAFLKELTEGECTEVLLDNDMHIRVKCGEEVRLETEIGEELLKKIYLSLRLAEGELIQLSGEYPFIVESLSICLDPPSAAVMERLLTDSGKQVILCV